MAPRARRDRDWRCLDSSYNWSDPRLEDPQDQWLRLRALAAGLPLLAQEEGLPPGTHPLAVLVKASD